MRKKSAFLSQFLTWSAKKAGNPITFVIALSVVVVWLILGSIYGFSPLWILILNTVATLNAALMVFIIQNTQNRESKALHLKLDELIRASKEAENELMAIESMEEEELEGLRERFHHKTRKK